MSRLRKEDAQATLPLSEEEELAAPVSRGPLDLPATPGEESAEVSAEVPLRYIMTAPVVTVRPTDTVFEALTRMIERGISGLPVVSGKRVVGVISQNDVGRLLAETTRLTPMGTVLEIATARGADDPATPLGRHAKELRQLKVRDAMTPEPVTIPAPSTVGQAVEQMESARVKRLPVVDAKGQLVGIVTRKDLLKSLMRHRGRSHAM